MLQNIRDRTSGIVAGFIIAIIAIPFAFWGIESFNSGGGDPVVAKVGDQKIHQSQFQSAYEQRYQQLQQMLGENFRADMFDQTRFRKSVLDDMTQESMLRQFTHEAGYHASDAALFEYISGIPAFQRDGKFDTEVYKEALSRQGMSVQRFETQLRDSIEIDQMREAVLETGFVTDAEARLSYQLANQQRWLSYVLFDHQKYLAQVTVSDEEVQARFEQDKSRYLAPERIKLAYIELALDALPLTKAPDNDVLKVIYDAEKVSRFTTQEERKARHILLNFGADKSEAKKKLEDLATQIKGGADFAKLAENNSDDPGSKAKGGDLGWVRRGQMVKSFETALFELKAGETSEPVESEFGWHLIRLEEAKASITKPLEDADVQRELIELYQAREQQKHFQELSEKLELLAFENPTSLEAAAKDLNLPIQTTDWFTRAGGAGLAANDAVKAAAFSQEVAKDGENSKPISTGDNKLAVIRKAEYEPARQKALDEVREVVREALRLEAAKAKAQADAGEVLKAAQGGQSLVDAAVAKGGELKSPGLVRRDNTAEDKAIVQALFRMPRVKSGETKFADVKLDSGAVAVLALSAVQDPDWPASDAGALAKDRKQLRDAVAGAEFGGYRQSIEGKIKVELVAAPVTQTAEKPDAETGDK